MTHQVSSEEQSTKLLSIYSNGYECDFRPERRQNKTISLTLVAAIASLLLGCVPTVKPEPEYHPRQLHYNSLANPPIIPRKFTKVDAHPVV
ncbi:hypothetical protein GCM10025776_26400 [Corallincola platygyrae]